MRINQTVKANGVVVRGFKNRRLVVSIPNSLEPMAVNVPLADIRQVAVLGADPTDTEKRFTVAAQIGPDRWVRLGVFDSAMAAEAVIQSVAKAIAGSRWTKVWATMGLSIVTGFIFVVLGAMFINATKRPGTTGLEVPQTAAPVAQSAPAPPHIEMPAQPALVQDDALAASISGGVAPAAVSAAPAAGNGSVGLQMTPENEASMRDYFGAKK